VRWIKSDAHKMQTRLDRFYGSEAAVPFSGSCRHVPVPARISDHISRVEVVLRSINCATKGPSYWKLNTSLMKRPGFDKIVKQEIEEFKSSRERYPNWSTWWEMLKLAIQLRLKQYSKQQSVRRKKTILTMESQLCQVNNAA
jgi:hypothetical protein